MNWAVIGLCLLHFLWQGALLGAIAGTLMLAMRKSSAQVRYLTGCSILLAMSACPLLTAWALSSQKFPLNAPNAFALDFRFVVLPWLIGVVLLTVRLAGGFRGYARLSRTGLSAAPEHLQERFDSLAQLLGLRIKPCLYLSSKVSVPTAIGFLKGTVLLPISVVCGVSPKMLDALLLHELAHVSRFDFLANATQCVVEVVLFYHPAVWWLSKRIRQERENCCDDIVINAFQDRTTYAKALAAAAELRPQPLAVRSDGGDLLTRVHRILGKTEAGPRTSPILITLLLAIFLLTPILAGFRTPTTSPSHLSLPSHAEKMHKASTVDETAIKADPSETPLIVEAVSPVEAVDKETAIKNGWITADK